MSDGLPALWVSAPLELLIACALGGEWGKPPEEDDTELVDVAVIRGTEFRNWWTDRGTTAAHRRIERRSLDKRRLQAGNLVVEVSGGGPTQPVGRVLLIDDEAIARAERPLICSNFCRKIELKNGLDPAFVTRALHHAYDRGDVEQYQSNTTNIRNLNFGRFTAETIIPLPPLNEQKRIVAKIEALQARSDAAKQALEAIPPLLEKLRQSILAAAFRGDLTRAWREAHPDVEPASVLLERIRAERRRKWEEANPGKKYVEPDPVDTSRLPEIPMGWCWASLEELSSATRPICYGVVQPGEDEFGGIPLVRVCDITDGTVNTTNLRTIPKEVAAGYDRSKLEGGEVLVTVVGTIGRVGVAPPSLRGANIARAVARIVPAESIGSHWLLFALQSPNLQDTLARESREVARKTLNIGTLTGLAVPLAPQAEASVVIDRLIQFLAYERQIRSRSMAMEQPLLHLTQSILAKAFRGELVPQDPNDEPASVLLERIRAEREATPAKPKRSAAKSAKAANLRTKAPKPTRSRKPAP